MLGKTTKFEDYLHLEYSHIAEAHHKTNETISTFFKHYLVIMTIPIAVIAYIITNEAETAKYNEVIKYIKPYVGYLLLVISLVGFAVMVHIINLRLDSLLYARTVNSIRKFFYDNADIDINIKLRMRTLPQTALLPAYFEKNYFLPVIFGFAFLNTFYFSCSMRFADLIDSNLLNWGAAALFLLEHLLFYSAFARYRETGYLKSSIIGVDIDGVMNKHKKQFCSLLKKKTGKKLTPSQITHIPVHESNLGVTREDEIKVFNDPKYWVKMPLVKDSPENLKKLRNSFKFKLYIFTHRAWPNLKAVSINRGKILSEWRTAMCLYEHQVYKSLSTWDKVRLSAGYILNLFLIRFRSKGLVRRLTILWLRYYKFHYDKLIIEKGNEDTTDPRGLFRNRFQFSRRKRIKFFVEDDLEKAIKLAFICDVIFLIEHPYNKPEKFKTTVPSNIIRVKSWNEVYRNIRTLS